MHNNRENLLLVKMKEKKKNLLKIQPLPKVLRVQAIRSKQIRNIYVYLYIYIRIYVYICCSRDSAKIPQYFNISMCMYASISQSECMYSCCGIYCCRESANTPQYLNLNTPQYLNLVASLLTHHNI